MVQGVGFRPALHRLAAELGLGGTIRNVSGGVELQLDGPLPSLELLLQRLPGSLPAAAQLEPLQPQWLAVPAGAAPPNGLTIAAGPPRPLGVGLVAPALVPDRAPCPQCLAELADPADRRFRYPFLSCSTCGPRYSIATAEPWARAHTTLAGFPLCPACRQEFEDPADRRFHAETIGCPACGPRLRWFDRAGRPAGAGEGEAALAAALALLRAGGILALQGVGGFQLLVNAADGDAVARLRARKRRPHKPFALLVDDLERLAHLLDPTPAERRELADPAAPIVLLSCRDDRHSAALPRVAPAAPGLGVMLPASPLHWLLARDFAGPLVATSGNRGGEPLCIEPAEALERLAGIADGFLVHDRPIARSLDDSVLQLIDGRAALLRRARGYAPQPLTLASAGPAEEGAAVLALGGDLKSAPALALGDRLWLAPHLGDLADPRCQERWRSGLAALLQRHGDGLAAVAVDRHPGYLSHQGAADLLAAAQLADTVPLRAVGHHRAHGLAVAAEHGLALPLAVLALDGLGYGDAPAPLWGCELLWLERLGADEGARRLAVRRLASLRPFPLPGGERAMREPRRSALGLLVEAGLLSHPGAAAVRDAFAPAERQLLEQAIASGCNAPRTSSAGRLFDAVAALLALVDVASPGVASHEAQAGLALQAAALRTAALRTGEAAGAYPLPLLVAGASEAEGGATPALLDWLPLLQALLDDIHAGQPPELCAARFHNGLVAGLAAAVEVLLPEVQLPHASVVALAGGCFQNRLLLEGLIGALREGGRRPCWSERLPLNDGGLAAGQVLAVRQDIAAFAGSVSPPVLAR